MTKYLKQDERSPIDPKKVFGSKGDKVEVVSNLGGVCIVSKNGDRFPVKTVNLLDQRP